MIHGYFRFIIFSHSLLFDVIDILSVVCCCRYECDLQNNGKCTSTSLPLVNEQNAKKQLKRFFNFELHFLTIFAFTFGSLFAVGSNASVANFMKLN